MEREEKRARMSVIIIIIHYYSIFQSLEGLCIHLHLHCVDISHTPTPTLLKYMTSQKMNGQRPAKTVDTP